jgi:hypothetical protein
MLPSVRRRIARDFEPLKRLPRGVVLAAGALMVAPVALALLALQAKASESELASSMTLTSFEQSVTPPTSPLESTRVEAPCVTKPAASDEDEARSDETETNEKDVSSSR